MTNLDSQLAGVKTVAIAGHIRPDGDCTGSCLATYNYIKENYKEIHTVLYLQPIPNIFKFLKGSDEIVSDCSEDIAYDLFIAQDCGDEGRLGDAVKYFHTAKRTICVDHHISNDSFADENYIYPYASSTSELIYDLLDKEKISKAVAECIYVGIVHDTGVFQYSCTSAKTMRIAGELMEIGINFSKIIDETFFTKTYSQNRIMGQALVDSRRYLEDRVIASYVTLEEMAQYDALPKHLEGIVSQLRVTKGVEAAVFMYENEDGTYKVSTRSSGKVDVAKIAMTFGGGGHARAAGFTMTGKPEEIIQQILPEIEKQL